jgi:hypothetical protein
MANDPVVSGRAFLGLIRHVKDERGATALDAIVHAAGPATRAVFAQPISVLAWHPYEAFTGFLISVDRTLGRGDHAYCRVLGSAAGKRDLGTILRVYVALASAERLIRSCGKVWPSYYRNAGTMEAVAWEPTRTILRIRDFPTMHPTHCKLMEGWMASTMETIGFRVGPGAAETQCTSRGGPYHEFSCTWSRSRG